jgi:hypothetical protein
MTDIHVYQQALREHAVELGINLDEDPEFYWIAEESLVAPLPEGWVNYHCNIQLLESYYSHH